MDDMGYQLKHIRIPFKREYLHHQLIIFYQSKYHKERAPPYLAKKQVRVL